jgi:hypothetical protein
MDFVFGLLKDAGLASQPPWLLVALAAIIPASLLLLFMALGPILYVYAETKLAGFFQDRIGPKRVGPHGILQTVADAVKLLFKEAIFPAGVDKFLFVLAPCLVVVGAFRPRSSPTRSPRSWCCSSSSSRWAACLSRTSPPRSSAACRTGSSSGTSP